MRNKSGTDAEILSQIPGARERGRLARISEPRAIGARYSSVTGRLTVILANDARFSFPTALAPGLRKANPTELAKVHVSPSGEGLIWPDIDADLSVAGILEAMVGGKLLMSALGRAGGVVRSDAKARASRLNGAKGGRPKVKKSDRGR